ncbi:cation diffusion facilitator family transporter [Thermus oshimai]|uniref:Cation transporter n=1 Tax=Thermus scotoductus TaxID=37636 RepID=A0A430RF47_THESC|nr:MULTISPECIES: cation diffusion facilitator family transporter [Thermus]RTG97735.1 cation transporter [Thermus scotoductus]RTH06268.1 cation transporter [Thermus scotoductus]RTH22704.1 cation transporter [Thermus scotoductus]RTI02253.1 cation transporter [Thermus scotoductus]RTI24586.1 cation transporter [Thermus scotoductus]
MAENAARLSLVVALLVLGLKAFAYLLTGSVALLSDALESLVNVAAALLALLAIRFAQRPPDETHPFGHSKAEYFSAVLEGVLVVLAAFLIAKESIPRLLHPRPLGDLGPGLLVSLLASLINGLLAWHLLRQGRRLRSPALTADGYHVLSDVLTSVGVFAGVSLAWATGLWVLDPLLALLVAGDILLMGFRLVRQSVGGLMDEGLSPAEVSRIRKTIAEALGGRALEVHDLKTRKAGNRAFLEFHLVVPGSMTVEEAHRLCDELERALEESFPGLAVTIHVEPESERKR